MGTRFPSASVILVPGNRDTVSLGGAVCRYVLFSSYMHKYLPFLALCIGISFYKKSALGAKVQTGMKTERDFFPALCAYNNL